MAKPKESTNEIDKADNAIAEPKSEKRKKSYDVHTLKLNSEFAKKYEKRKRHEILSNLNETTRQQIEGNSSDEEESSDEDVEEDEFGELLTKKMDAQISRTLHALLRKDPAIYDKNTVYFEGSRNDLKKDDDEGENDDGDNSDVDSGDEPVAGWDTITKAAEADAPKMTIKDYVRETLLKEGELPDSDDERVTRRRYVAEENEEVARSKTILNDNGDNQSRSEGSDSDESDDKDANENEREKNNEESSSESEDSDSSEGDSESEEKDKKETKKMSMPSLKKEQKADNSKQDLKSAKDDADDDDDDDDDDDFFTVKKKTPEELEKEEKDFEAWTQELSRKKASAPSEERYLHSYLDKESTEEKERFLRDFVLNNGWLDNQESSYGIERNIEGIANDENDEEYEDDEEFEDKVDAFEAKYNFRFEDPDGVQMQSHARDTLTSLRRPDDRRKKAREARKARKEKEKLLKTEEIKQLKNVKKREIQSRLLALQEAAGDGVDLTGIDLEGDFDAEAFSAQMEKKFGEEYYNNEDTKFDIGKSRPNAEEVAGEEVDAETKQAVEGLMEEYYNLDYEDIVGGQAVRFKYKQVDREDFGMTAEEILMEEDKELNKRASFKYLAPYRDRQEVKKRAKTARWKANYKCGRRAVKNEENARQGRGQKRRRVDEESTAKTVVGASVATENDEREKSGKKRKKRRHGKKASKEENIEKLAEPDKKTKKKKSVVDGMSAKRRAAYNIE